MIAVCLCVLLFICGILYSYRKSRRRVWELAALLPGETPLSMISNTRQFSGKSTFRIILEIIDRHGPTCKFWLGPRLCVLITNPEDVQTVLLHSGSVTRDRFMMSVLKPYTGNGLITSCGNTWRQHRKIMQPAFHSKVLRQYSIIFHRNAEILANNLSNVVGCSTFDIYPYIAECTLNMICETTLGAAPSSLGKEFAKLFHRGLHIIEERVAKPWLLIKWLFKHTKLGQEQESIMNILDSTTNLKISESLQSQNIVLENNAMQGDSVTNSLDLLTKPRDEENIVNREFLRDEINTLLIAGQETTATAMSFALVELGIHQDIQEMVYKELEDIFQEDPNAETTPEHLMKMKQLDCVLKETLRLFPAAPLVTRELDKELNINNYTLPAGCTALIVSYKTHRIPHHFPNPEKFDPSRFSTQATHSRHPYSYIPFGGGAKICIGQRYAMLQMKTVLSHVLRHYKVFSDCTPESLQDLQMGMVLRPTNGYRLNLQKR